MDIYRDRIKPLFDESGLSLKEIASLIGVPVKYIYNWNNGITSYKNYLYQIAYAFHISVEYLKGETDEKSPPQVADGLTDMERRFIELFRLLPASSQDSLLRRVEAAVQNLQALDAPLE